MIIIFVKVDSIFELQEQLGVEAVQMTQTGISDYEINKIIADKFRRTKDIAERQVQVSNEI